MPLVSFSCVEVEDRPELWGGAGLLAVLRMGWVFLLCLHLMHYCSAVGTVGPSQLASQNGTGADNRKCIPKVGAGKGRGV